jgi:hypothetical protein
VAFESAWCLGRRGKGRGWSAQCLVGQEKERRRGVGMAQTRWLRAAPIAAGGARNTGVAGAAVIGEDSGARQRGHGRLTSGVR